jgi:ribose 5-phosphate isomerase B
VGVSEIRRVGIAGDHAGFGLKQRVVDLLKQDGYELVDFGAHCYDAEDDYPDFVVPLARAVAAGEVERGIAVCGSGVGASVVANKVAGARAAILHDVFSARQGVEDDDVNLMCLGGRVIGEATAAELMRAFLAARFSAAERHARRVRKVLEVERSRS